MHVLQALVDGKLTDPPVPTPQPAPQPALSETSDLGPPSQDWADPPPARRGASGRCSRLAPVAEPETPGPGRRRQQQAAVSPSSPQRERSGNGLMWIGSPCAAPSDAAQLQRTFFRGFMLVRACRCCLRVAGLELHAECRDVMLCMSPHAYDAMLYCIHNHGTPLAKQLCQHVKPGTVCDWQTSLSRRNRA